MVATAVCAGIQQVLNAVITIAFVFVYLNSTIPLTGTI